VTYTVFTEENEHYMDRSARRWYGEYETLGEAVAAARQIVNADLESMYHPGMSAKTLFQSYTHYGTDAYVVPEDEGTHFSA
jgi:hypothetical protein